MALAVRIYGRSAGALALGLFAFAGGCEQGKTPMGPRAAGRGALSLHPTSAMVRIGGPTGVSQPPEAYSYVLELAGEESEAFQVMVRRKDGEEATDTTPLEVVVELENVPKRGGYPTPADWIRVYQVLDVHYRGPVDHPKFKVPIRNLGWIPDVCYPTLKAKAQAHKPDRVTFLFDVVKMPPWPVERLQQYRLILSFREVGREEESSATALDLKLTKRRFGISRRLPFKTGVTWNWGIEKYLGRELTTEESQGYHYFFLRYRLTPTSFFTKGLGKHRDHLGAVADQGGNLFQLFHIGGGGGRLLTEQQKREYEPRLKEWRRYMGHIDEELKCCYALVADEPEEKDFSTIRKNVEWLKSVFPELKIWVATRPRQELLDIVDVWDVVVAHSTDLYAAHSFTRESLDLARGAEKKPEVWWFFSVEPYGPHPNVRIDDTLADARAIGWLSFANRLDGFEYFWATDWAANAHLRDVPYPEKAERWELGLAGAGVLCYPDEKGSPIPSLRLINLRDAMEDWWAFLCYDWYRESLINYGAADLAGQDLRELWPVDTRDAQELAGIRRKVYQELWQHHKKLERFLPPLHVRHPIASPAYR